MAHILKFILKTTDHATARQLATFALLISVAGMMQLAHADGAKRIVKWKDEKGVTHYGDSIPPQYADRDNAVMNKQGVTLQQNKPNAPHPSKDEEFAKSEQLKRDRALLGTFSSTEEIDLTRDRNLEPEQLALKSLQQDRAVAQKKADDAAAAAAAYTKSKKPVPPAISTTVKTSNENLAKVDHRISERQQAIDAIRKRFEDDKKRYLELKSPTQAIPTNTPSGSTPNK